VQDGVPLAVVADASGARGLVTRRVSHALGRIALIGLALASASGAVRRPDADEPLTVAPDTLVVMADDEPSSDAPPEEVAPGERDATNEARAPFDWAGAVCPRTGTEPHAVLVTPRSLAKERSVRVLVALEREERGPFEARFQAADGRSYVTTGSTIVVPDATTRGLLFVAPPSTAIEAVQLRVGPRLVACREVAPSAPATRRWDAQTEALYSLWIARLFSFPEDIAHAALADVLRDPGLNLLHDHLGLGEDAPTSGLRLAPDCADFPLTLRLYFAWKLGLPFGFDRSYQPRAKKPEASAENAASDADIYDDGPVRPARKTTFDLVLDGRSPADLASFAAGNTRLGDTSSTKTLRRDGASERSLLYPIAMTRESLRPGAVFVDAFSHVSVVAGWLDAGAEARRLLVVDAQPSGMIAVHRNVEGRLVYRQGRGSVGFRWYRPTLQTRHEKARPASTLELSRRSDAHLRPAQDELSRSEASFSETLDALEDPRPREPVKRFRELHDALVEALRERVRVVAEGYARRQSLGADTPLPTTASMLFHGFGVWEADSTPCRDLHLLGLLRTIAAFPEAVASNPTRYASNPDETPAALRARLEEARTRWLDELGVDYTRSDGSTFHLTLREVFARREAFEMAYNPNDCPELRWGAPPGSDEHRTCSQRVSPDDRAKMDAYRSWFQEGYGCE